MLEFIGGAMLGAIGGYIAKDKISGSKDNCNNNSELESLYRDNERLSRHNKEMERQIEDLTRDLEKYIKQAKQSDDDASDFEDELAEVKRELKRVEALYNNSVVELREYKMACQSKDTEIESLKEKLNKQ